MTLNDRVVVLGVDLGGDGAAVLGDVDLRGRSVRVLGAFRWTRWAHEPRATKQIILANKAKRTVPTEWSDLEAFYSRLRKNGARYRKELARLLAIADPEYWASEFNFTRESRGRRDLAHRISLQVVKSQKALWGWFLGEMEWRVPEAEYVPVKPVGGTEAALAWQATACTTEELRESGGGPSGEHVRDAAGVIRASVREIARRLQAGSANYA